MFVLQFYLFLHNMLNHTIKVMTKIFYIIKF